MLRIVTKLMMKGKRPRQMWLDNIDRHLKLKSTSLKEVIGTKCFENRDDWRKSIYLPSDRSSEEDPRAHAWSMVSRW